jgi:endogenous inhibitor of DNA gyrase (YacG/DUF329 family)
MMVEPERDTKYLPFCSLRCRMIDLGRWLSEEHAVPCKSDDEELEQPNQSSGGVQLPPGWHDA